RSYPAFSSASTRSSRSRLSPVVKRSVASRNSVGLGSGTSSAAGVATTTSGSPASKRRQTTARSASLSRWRPPRHRRGSRSGNSTAGAPKNLRSCAQRWASTSVATTISSGRGCAWTRPATTSARADPVSPATRRQASPSAKAFTSSLKAAHSLNITNVFTLSRLPPRTTASSFTEAGNLMGSRCLAGGLREIEAQRLELDREVDVLEPHVTRHADPGGGKVEHSLDPGDDELVGHRLGRFRRHRNDGHLHAARLDLPREITCGEDRDSVDLAVSFHRIVVEDDCDPEALTPEAAIVEERRAEVTEADERDRPFLVESENALELGLQARNVIADAANAELPEVRQVLAHLRRVQIEAVGQILRGHRLHAVFLELPETARVHGEPTHGHLRDPWEPGARTAGHRRERGRRGAPALVNLLRFDRLHEQQDHRDDEDVDRQGLDEGQSDDHRGLNARRRSRLTSHRIDRCGHRPPLPQPAQPRCQRHADPGRDDGERADPSAGGGGSLRSRQAWKCEHCPECQHQ